MNTKKLIINQPELVTSKGVARVTCDIIEENDSGETFEKTVTFDVEKKWSKYLVTENVNAYLVACLPYAMRNKMDIKLLAPVSSELLHNIEMYLIPHLAKYDSRLYPTKIHTSYIETTNLKNAGAVGTGMSMGVDSFHTVHQYINPKYSNLKLTHLFVEQVGDLLDGVTSTKHMRNVNKQTVDEVADTLSLPVIYGYSNIRQLFRMSHYHTHTYTAMFNIHMMAKLFKSYFYASTEDFSHFGLINNSTHDAALYELLSLQSLSTDSLRLMSGGAASDRTEKTKELADSSAARNFLRVCLVEELNCMECMKCRRTLLTLDMQENLDKFKNVFDIPTYKNNKEEYLKWLIKSYHKNAKGISVKELYDFFYSTERETMNRLEKWCLKDYMPMELPKYLRVNSRTQKVNPSTGKKYRSAISEGKDVYFVDELYVNGVHYLRSREDSLDRKECAIPSESLRKIEFQSMKNPRRLKLIQSIKKVNPYTGVDSGKDIEAGTSIQFTDSITVDGTQYLRSSHDSRENRDLAISMDNLTKKG